MIYLPEYHICYFQMSFPIRNLEWFSMIYGYFRTIESRTCLTDNLISIMKNAFINYFEKGTYHTLRFTTLYNTDITFLSFEFGNSNNHAYLFTIIITCLGAIKMARTAWIASFALAKIVTNDEVYPIIQLENTDLLRVARHRQIAPEFWPEKGYITKESTPSDACSDGVPTKIKWREIGSDLLRFAHWVNLTLNLGFCNRAPAGLTVLAERLVKVDVDQVLETLTKMENNLCFKGKNGTFSWMDLVDSNFICTFAPIKGFP